MGTAQGWCTLELSFGERLALARKRAGFKSQGDLADRIEASRNAVGQWERDETLPDGKSMVQLPGVLGISGHWLLTGEGDMLPPDPDQAVVLLDVIRYVATDADADDAAALRAWIRARESERE